MKFGESRDKCPIIGQKNIDKEKLYPGPGQYDP